MRMAEELTARVKEAIYGLVEEETGRKLGELTIVTEVREVSPGEIKITFTPLSAYSPTAVDLGRRVREAATKVEGVKTALVECDGHLQDELVNKLVNGPKAV